MKLLFDANLSPALVTGLAIEYHKSTHVRDAGLRDASDSEIWTYAKANEFVIVSKDTDFRERSFVEGFPRKSFGLTLETRERSTSSPYLQRERQRVEEFERLPDASLLILFLGASAV